MSGWQTIDTAPKDGSEVLLFFPGNKSPIRIGHYTKTEHLEHGKVIYRSEGWSSGFLVIGKHNPVPSHWMPLPLGP